MDFRKLRDEQTPDLMGNIIPLNVDNGQIAWSACGAANKVMTGRSEQISLSEGVASTYACYNPCPNSIYGSKIEPVPVSLTSVAVGETLEFTAQQRVSPKASSPIRTQTRR